MHEWKVPSLKFSLFRGGPQTFQDKEPGLFYFLARFLFFCEVLCTKTLYHLYCKYKCNSSRAHGEVLHSKVKKIIRLQM